MKAIFLNFLFFTFGLALALPSVAFTEGPVNLRLNRAINLETHLEEVIIAHEVDNVSSFYLFAIPPAKAPRLSWFEARLKASGKPLASERVAVTGSNAPEGTVFYRIDLSSVSKKPVKFEVVLVFTRTLKPFPAEISQNEPQMVLYNDNLYVFSLYKSQHQVTSVKLASNKIESHSRKNAEVKGNTIEYGPYTEITPFSFAPLNIHFENEYPFMTFTSARRNIEVSHYGNVNVEEEFMLENTGATLKGGFSRFDYQRQQKAGASFRSFVARLPPTASNIYYRDQIGNISTSNVRYTRDAAVMEVQPRFPMFGGWKTDFYIGYDVPAHQFLFVDSNDSGRYVLNISFSSPFPQAVIDDMEVRVILPEFAYDIQWVTPFDVDEESRQSVVTYLDTVGRPVLVLKKARLVRLHEKPFQVVYRFSSIYMLQEPLLIVGSILLFFIASMATLSGSKSD